MPSPTAMKCRVAANGMEAAARAAVQLSPNKGQHMTKTVPIPAQQKLVESLLHHAAGTDYMCHFLMCISFLPSPCCTSPA